MDIKERIEKLGSYFVSMNLSAENGIIYVLVNFPKSWGCSEVTEYNFNVKSVKDDAPGYVYFFADMEVGFDKIFDAIEYNITFNQDAEAKVNLLKEKIEELKDIFENEDIDTLKTLEFKLKKKKNTKIKKKSTNEKNGCVESCTKSIENSNNYEEVQEEIKEIEECEYYEEVEETRNFEE